MDTGTMILQGGTRFPVGFENPLPVVDIIDTSVETIQGSECKLRGVIRMRGPLIKAEGLLRFKLESFEEGKSVWSRSKYSDRFYGFDGPEYHFLAGGRRYEAFSDFQPVPSAFQPHFKSDPPGVITEAMEMPDNLHGLVLYVDFQLGKALSVVGLMVQEDEKRPGHFVRLGQFWDGTLTKRSKLRKMGVTKKSGKEVYSMKGLPKQREILLV